MKTRTNVCISTLAVAVLGAYAADDVLFVRSSSLSLGFDKRNGRVVKVVAADGTAPAVFVAAYESEDGRRAFVLANATTDKQDVRCVWPGGKTMEFQLEPRDLRLVKEISGQSTTKKEAK